VPVDPSSRYYGLGAHDAAGRDGVARPTVPARPTPAPRVFPKVHVVVAGDTVESLAHRYLGSSAAWWVVADANALVFPFDLQPGDTVAIPDGRPPLERTRRF
jgi:nucleoid-associated protein YgaU